MASSITAYTVNLDTLKLQSYFTMSTNILISKKKIKYILISNPQNKVNLIAHEFQTIKTSKQNKHFKTTNCDFYNAFQEYKMQIVQETFLKFTFSIQYLHVYIRCSKAPKIDWSVSSIISLILQ